MLGCRSPPTALPQVSSKWTVLSSITFCLSLLVALLLANGGKTEFDGVYGEMHPLRRWCYFCIAAVTGAVSKCLTCTELGHNLIKLSHSI